jgi:hypothetical protein
MTAGHDLRPDVDALAAATHDRIGREGLSASSAADAPRFREVIADAIRKAVGEEWQACILACGALAREPGPQGSYSRGFHDAVVQCLIALEGRIGK